nr:Methionyl-tRNA synthetase (EC 6.1.1.10) [Kibdelosporangium sp. MJ126-NF4]
MTTTARASALELVHADVLARHRRMTGARVRFLGGGISTLRSSLALSYNDFDATETPVPRYVTALGAGHYERWWATSDERIHVIGESARRQHEVGWPAHLRESGVQQPTAILVRPDIPELDIGALAGRYGSDAVRWWLLRDESLDPDRIVHLANRDLHKRLGSLIDRVTGLVHRYRDGEPPPGGTWPAVSGPVRAALARFEFIAAADAIWQVVDDAGDYLTMSRPWDLAVGRQDSELDTVLATLLAACRTLANELTPFLPELATRIAQQTFALSGSLAPSRTVYARLRR